MSYEYRVYVDGNLQGTTSNLYWDLSLSLSVFTAYTWRIDTYDTESGIVVAGDTWLFATRMSNNFPHSRRSDYDSDLVWGWDAVNNEYAWLSSELTGGGRYKNQIVVVGRKKIYFGGT